jgi:UDP-3-O-[3-hydroxymyristoyl] glucosamine N-acyltransferase
VAAAVVRACDAETVAADAATFLAAVAIARGEPPSDVAAVDAEVAVDDEAAVDAEASVGEEAPVDEEAAVDAEAAVGAEAVAMKVGIAVAVARQHFRSTR